MRNRPPAKPQPAPVPQQAPEQEAPAVNYALLDASARVVEIFERPTASFVQFYNTTHSSRIRPCPDEVQVGWLFFRQSYCPPSSPAPQDPQ